jgi:M-phase inducer tyrosine phosphatase
MSTFTRSSSKYLSPPSAPIASHRKQAQKGFKDDVDDFLSSDLELSFASTSLDSPPRDCIALTPENEYPQPMDISPVPALKTSGAFKGARPRAFTTDARIFGNNIVNKLPSLQHPTPSPNQSNTSNNTSASQSGSKKTQRSALPMEWLMGGKAGSFEESLPSAVS